MNVKNTMKLVFGVIAFGIFISVAMVLELNNLLKKVDEEAKFVTNHIKQLMS